MKKTLAIVLAALIMATMAVAVSAVTLNDAPTVAETLTTSAGPFETLEDAAAAIGKTPILGATYVDGSVGNTNEDPSMLWDNDVTTKFCTGTFPTISVADLGASYTIDGIIMATANDNAEYNNRSPYDWTILGSADGETWTTIASGDDLYFEETNFTYYPAAIDATAAYRYIEFYSEGALSGCYQMSELVVCGTAADGAAAPVEEAPVEEAPATEAPVEETAAPETEAPVEEAPVATAPQTSDMFVIVAVVAMIAAAAVVTLKKVSVK